ncbi:MAG: penicillin acylase family protein, partial [Alphaproteobacteria bacterium]|nr:penicillin acylase family protein [Alphaproteobacteria bacterium]
MPVRTSLFVAAFALAGCTGAPEPIDGASAGLADAGPTAKPAFSAEIRRTAYGVPHIKADDFAGIGYGFGYASAQDNICEIADRMMTVTASRARYLGPGENDVHIASDVYHQRLIDMGEIESLLQGPAGSPDTPSA